MPDPALIVEGNSEQRAIQRLCPGKKVITLGLNGRDVSLPAISKQLDAIVRALSNRYYPLVVLFDREQRTVSREQLIHELKQLIELNGHDVRQFIIGVPDRKIENWMLPFIKDCFGENDKFLPPVYIEGSNDTGKIQDALRCYKKNYHKTTVGTELICSIKPDVLSEISVSFKDFRDQLKTFCPWAK